MTKTRLIYTGVYMTSEKKVAQGFKKEDELALEGTILFKDLIKHAIIGGIYDCEEKEEGRWSPGPYVGRLEDEGLIIRWKLRSDQVRVEKRAMSDDPLEDLVDPLRRIYVGLPNVQRAFMIQRILYYLAKGSPSW